MTSRAKLELKGFLISKEIGGFKTSLSISSTAFLYNISFENPSQTQILSSIKAKELWLLPPGSSRFDLRVDLHQLDISIGEASHFIESLAHALCQFSLWSRLGLVVKLLDNGIQYHQGDDSPNIYLSIEQLDMSAALLSPPRTHTAQLKGLESLLRFKSSVKSESSSGQGGQMDSGQLLWDDAIRLVEAALDFTVGVRQHCPTLKTHQIDDNAPSLLDIAPAIWNSHYLKSAAGHAKKFPVISSILASTATGQSSELRRQFTALLREVPPPAREDTSHEAEYVLDGPRSSIERRLWELLGATLKPTIGTAKRVRNDLLPEAVLERQYSSDQGRIIGEGGSDRHDMLLEYQFPSQSTHVSQDTIYHDSTSNTSGYFDLSGSQESTGTLVDEESIKQGNAPYHGQNSDQNLQPGLGSVHPEFQNVMETYPGYGHRNQELNHLRMFGGDQLSDTPRTSYGADHLHRYSAYPAMDYPEPE